MERVLGGWLVGDVLECPGCSLDLRECRFASLHAEAREPPQRGAFESIRLCLANDHSDRESVAEVDVREFGRGAATDGHVARLQGTSKAGICRPLTRHERMFA